MKYASLQLEEAESNADQDHASPERLSSVPNPVPVPTSRCHDRSLFLASISGFLILVGALSLKANHLQLVEGAEGDDDSPITSNSYLRSPSTAKQTSSAFSMSMSTFGSDFTMNPNEAMMNPCPMGDCGDATSTTNLFHKGEAETLGSGELISTNHNVEANDESMSTEPSDTSSSGTGPSQGLHVQESSTEATTASSEDDRNMNLELDSNEESLDQLTNQKETEKETAVARMEDEKDNLGP